MRLGRVDESLAEHGMERDIRVFTRHYHVAVQLAKQHKLIATVPTRLAQTIEKVTACWSFIKRRT